jgi:hypothetical protein
MTGSVMGPQESGSQMGPRGGKGGKEIGKDGRPKSIIPGNILTLKDTMITVLASKTGAWATLRTELSTNLSLDSGYKPKSGLVRSVILKINGNSQQILMKEFTKFQRNTESACPNDYLYYCKDGVCACSENNCPKEVIAVTAISLSNSVSQSFSNMALRYLQTAPASNNGTMPSGSGMQSQAVQTDVPTAYFICSICFGGKRYIYGQASFSNANFLDFNDGTGNNLGKDDIKQKNNCAKALASGSAGEKVECRGNMNDDCAKKMDNSCGATGLYNMLINNPVPQAALPLICDETVTGYTESGCFQWLMPKITKATLIFDHRRFKDLPREISNSFTNAIRVLQTDSTIKVVAQDPVQLKDPNAVIPISIAQVSSTEITVDGATINTTPTAVQYIQDLAQTTATINLSHSFLSTSISVLLVALSALLL